MQLANISLLDSTGLESTRSLNVVGPRERPHLAGEFRKVMWTESTLENDKILTSGALGD